MSGPTSPTRTITPSPIPSTTTGSLESERSASRASSLSDQELELDSQTLLKQLHALLLSYNWSLSAFQSVRDENAFLRQQVDEGKQREIILESTISERDRTITRLTEDSRRLAAITAELQATRLRLLDAELNKMSQK